MPPYLLEETNNGNIVSLNEGLSLINGRQVLGGRSSLLEYPVDDVVSLATTGVFNLRSLAVELQSWVSPDLVLLSQVALDGGIDLTQLDFRVLFEQLLGSCCVLWSKGLAVSAPWGV